MEQKKGMVQKYLLWSNERFPLVGVILYSGSVFYLSWFFANLFPGRKALSFYHSLPGFFVIFLVVLNIRIFDEHKDYKKDSMAYPDRILSRGIITLRDLRRLLYLALVIECLLSAWLGPDQVWVWLCIMAWSLLMLFEFFVPEFLNRHMGLYLFSHQLLLPLVFLYGFSMRYDLRSIQKEDLTTLLIFMAGMMFATITYEIARKTWSKEREHDHADSYTKFWGVGSAVWVNQGMALLSGCCFSALYISHHLNMAYTLVTGILFSVSLLTGLVFLKHPTTRHSKRVEAAGTLFLLGVFVNSIVAFGTF